jgi:TatA/E family protein of Tat protein translocase
MLGTLGTQEMIFIFLLALVLFGPKKLPEIGRTVGKAITEFRKASSELKSTFDREIRTLEQETKLSEVTDQFQHDTYNYDYSSYEATYEGAYGESYDSAAIDESTASASAPQDAESSSAVAIEGTIAQGSEIAETEGSYDYSGESPAPADSTEHQAASPSPAEHNA